MACLMVHVLSNIAIDISFRILYNTHPGIGPLAGQQYCGWQHLASHRHAFAKKQRCGDARLGSTVGKCALPVVIDCIRNFGGEGGQANIACHQMLIA